MGSWWTLKIQMYSQQENLRIDYLTVERQTEKIISKEKYP